MSVLALSAALKWSHSNPTEIPVMQRVIAEMNEKLFWGWRYEEEGPKLPFSGEILTSLFSDTITNDMKALKELGVTGVVTFGVSHSKYPIIKCVISSRGITWHGALIVPSLGVEAMFTHIDPITNEEVKLNGHRQST